MTFCVMILHLGSKVMYRRTRPLKLRFFKRKSRCRLGLRAWQMLCPTGFKPVTSDSLKEYGRAVSSTEKPQAKLVAFFINKKWWVIQGSNL